ncbi:hypothetical protein HOA55_04425 [archaeon]|jgi:hypothetical protein|nr:hypothetical protein [archaeon]MBT3577972.1 hypothetical protein [archaeon]MBT6820575.1 hypothetical protein [archaeon]MBT6956510.1 hypothetical protein [archaeon]MBT7025826.1 hypothetical protein [archaeon]
MNNKTKIISAAILLVVVIAVFGFRMTGKVIDEPEGLVESCFIRLEIGEDKIGEEIQFSLVGQENLYGNYGGLVDYYDDDGGIAEDYLLRVNDLEGDLLFSSALSSSRFVFYDNFGEDEEDLGGVLETESGIIPVIVPYIENIGSIRIENGEVETDLNVNVGEIICERTCMAEGETGSSDDESCCIGFIKSGGEPILLGDADGDGVVGELDTAVFQSQFGLIEEGLSADFDGDGDVDLSDFTFIRENMGGEPKTPFTCVNCGDGVCSDDEDPDLCPEDCIPEFSCPEDMIKMAYACSTSGQRFEDWRGDWISTDTMIGDTENYILPSLD